MTHRSSWHLVVWNPFFLPFQQFSKLWNDKFWLLVCVCFPAHAHLPAGWLVMDRLPLRWTQPTVILHHRCKCRIPDPFFVKCLPIFFFYKKMQVMFQEEQSSQGGDRSQGSHRRRIQETRAHKVRTCVCFHVSRDAYGTSSTSGWSAELFPFGLPAVFQFCGGGHLFLFRTLCHPSFYKRSKVFHWLVCAFQKRVRTQIQFSSSVVPRNIWWFSTCVTEICSSLPTGTSLTRSPVWSSRPSSSSSPQKNRPWAGGSTLKVSGHFWGTGPVHLSRPGEETMASAGLQRVECREVLWSALMFFYAIRYIWNPRLLSRLMMSYWVWSSAVTHLRIYGL